MEHIKWVFSGIGVLIISFIIGYIRYRQNKKKIKALSENNIKQPKRTVNQYGDKSLYIEKNKGDITIN